MVQDSTGYIWLGTNGGLVRFDGIRFVDNVGAPDLPLATVRALCVARDGSLWIGFGGAGGVSRMQNGKVTNYYVKDGIPSRLITNLAEAADGTVWASSSAGVSLFRNGRWQSVSGSMGLPYGGVSSLYADQRGTVWIGSGRGTFRLRSGHREFEPVSGAPASAFADDHVGGLWAAGEKLGVRNLEASGSSIPGLPDDVSTLEFDSEGNLWIGTLSQGVFRLSRDIQGRRVVQRLGVANGLTSNTVWSVLVDREGSIWIGTQNGLNQLSENTVTSLPAEGDEPMNTLVRAVASLGESVWVGTADGLYRFQGKTRARFGSESGLPSSSISSLMAHPSGTLWVSTAAGVSVFDGRHFSDLPTRTGVQLHRVNALAANSVGDVWLNDTQKSLWKWSRNQLDPVELPQALRNKNADAVFVDRKDRVWFGYVEGGCAVYDQGVFRTYEPTDGLARGPVTGFFEDQDGSLWISAVNGLSRLRDGHLVTATRANGLLGSVLTAVIGDSNGGLWLGSNAGIQRLLTTEFDRLHSDSGRAIRVELFASPEGLMGNPVTLGSPEVTQASDGTIWFPTTAGVAIIDPARATKPRVSLTAMLESAVADEKRLAMSHSERLVANVSRLEIDYTALSFLAPSRILFQYRLEPFDAHWINAGHRRRAVYTSLPPGTYRFSIMAGSDDLWSMAKQDWAFSIAPTFYQTRWFVAACIGGLLLFATLAWQIRSNQVKARFLLVMEERARVGREIHDTLLQTMTGLALEVHTVAVALGPVNETVKHSLVQLRDSIQESIRETRQSIWDLRLANPIKDRGQNLDVALRTAAQTVVASTGDVQLEFVTTGTPRKKPELDEHLFRLGQEAIRNAVAHASASRIQVELNYEAKFIVLRVVDNGCGFDVQDSTIRSSMHWGLATMEERARKIGADFRLVSRPGQGTMVEAVVKS